VKKDAILPLTAAVTLGLGALAAVQAAQAAMFDFMNPGEWFGNRHDRYYDHDYYRYGYGGPYGWGGPWGGYGGGPYGWRGGPWGGGYGPYGWGGGYPGYGGYGYGPGSTIVVTPQSSGSSSEKAPPPKLPE
jgi:hypothetical protein